MKNFPSGRSVQSKGYSRKNMFSFPRQNKLSRKTTEAIQKIEKNTSILLARIESLENSAVSQSEKLDAISRQVLLLDDAVKEEMTKNERTMADSKRSFLRVSDQVRDVLGVLLDAQSVEPNNWTFQADRTIALDTNDHRFPRGTMNDNTHHPRFVRACEELFDAPIKHLDVGCAGGGLVWDFASRGHLSVGIEGSNFSLLEQRAEWRTIPDRLFTADVCYPFSFTNTSNERVLFDVVSAWEFFEHIGSDQLDQLLENLRANIRPGGILAASVATFSDFDHSTQTEYHQTIKPKDWWVDKFEEYGFRYDDRLFETGDFVRGVGNLTAEDWDVRTQPDLGFHISLILQD